MQYKIYYYVLIIVSLCAVFSCAKPVYYVPYNNNRPSYPERYETYNQPRSRSYTKPYDVAPYQYYPYDYDQYYVPPTQYRNIENIERGTNASDSKY